MKQRILKFRAWDKEIKAFVYITLIKGSQFIFEVPGIESKGGWSKKALGEWHQYTGLHDKRGKEIFEGDLIQTILKEPYVVRYDDSLGQFFGERKSREERETIKISGIAFNRYKVIGNICEHKK